MGKAGAELILENARGFRQLHPPSGSHDVTNPIKSPEAKQVTPKEPVSSWPPASMLDRRPQAWKGPLGSVKAFSPKLGGSPPAAHFSARCSDSLSSACPPAPHQRACYAQEDFGCSYVYGSVYLPHWADSSSDENSLITILVFQCQTQHWG